MAYRNKEKERETRKRYYWKHIEKERECGRKRKAAYRAANGDKINARQRAWYRKNKARALERIYANRIRREPWRGIGAAVTAYERGDLTISELTELIDNRLGLTDEVDREAKRKLRTPGCGRGVGRVRDSQRDRRLSKNKMPNDAAASGHDQTTPPKEETCLAQIQQTNKS